MTKGERIILGFLIFALTFGAVIWKRQADLQHKQRQIEQQQQRNPFYEPATNSDKTTIP